MMITAKRRMLSLCLAVVTALTMPLSISAETWTEELEPHSIGTSLGHSDSGPPTYESYEPEGVIKYPLDGKKTMLRTGAQPISSLPLGTVINLPVGDYAYPFKVMVKDHSAYDPGVVLMSTQVLQRTVNRVPNLQSAAAGYASGGSRDWMLNTWYPQISEPVRSKMRTAHIADTYVWVDKYGNQTNYWSWMDDYVFIPSEVEATARFNPVAPEQGKSWGLTDNLRGLVNPENPYGLYGYHCRTRAALYNGGGMELCVVWGAWRNDAPYVVVQSQTLHQDAVAENIAPCILLSNDTMISTTPGAGGGFEIVTNAPPTIPGAISNPATVNAWSAGTVLFTWGASTDPDGDPITYIVEQSVNGGGWIQATTTSATSYSYTIGANATSVKIRVKASDGQADSGYRESSPTAIQYDITKPTIAASLSPSGWTNGNVTIHLTLTDAESGLNSLVLPSRLSGTGTVSLSGASAERSYTATSNGSYTFILTDNAGNTQSSTVVIDKIDRVTPVLSIDATQKQYHNADSTTLTATASSALSGVASIEPPTGAISASNPLAHTITENGTYTFTVRDNAGNTQAASYEYHWFDRTPPTIDSLTFRKTGTSLLPESRAIFDGTISNEQIEFVLECSDAPTGNEAESGVSTFSYAVFSADDAVIYPWRTVPLHQLPTLDSQMEGYVLAYVTDHAGNQSAQQRYNLLLDSTKPTITYTLSTTEFTRSPVDAIFTGADEGSGFDRFVLLETGDEYPGDSFTYTFEHNHSITVRGYDIAGNWEEIAVTVSNIDLTPPQIVSLTFEKTGEKLLDRVRSFFGIGRSKTAANEQVRMRLEASDTPNGSDATSGLASFSYRIYSGDDTPITGWNTYSMDQMDSIPPIDFAFNGYVLAYVTDNAGNHSYERDEHQIGDKFPLSLDSTKPNIRYTLSTTKYTNEPIAAALTGSDADSGFERWVVPSLDMSYQGDSMEYIFDENGSVEILGYDYAGNFDTVNIVVDNIDRTPPTIESLTLKKVQPFLLQRVVAFFMGAGEPQVQVVIRCNDTPQGNDAESGVATFSYQLFDPSDIAISELVTVPIDAIPILAPFTGYMVAYITDYAGNASYEGDDEGNGIKYD